MSLILAALIVDNSRPFDSMPNIIILFIVFLFSFLFLSFILNFVAAGRKIFREFLRSEYSEENMLFWIACEDLKTTENPDMVEEKARLIYEDYISILSPKEVIV